jgi:RNA polymerase sigma factor (sigma-70 family)
MDINQSKIEDLEKDVFSNFGDLVKILEPKIKCLLLSRGCNQQDIDDIMQDTYVSALKTVKDFDGKNSSFYTWLANISFRRMIDHWRKKSGRTKDPNKAIKIRNAISLDQQFTDNDNNIVSLSDTIECRRKSSSFEIDEIEDVRRIHPRSDDQKNFVYLFYGRGLTKSKVADYLGVCEGTASSKLHYAIKSLRQNFRRHTRGKSFN